MMAIMLLQCVPAFLAAGGGDSASTLSGILSMATELMTWVITQMGSLLTFITSNPVILVYFIIAIVGFAVGMLMRIWRSV